MATHLRENVSIETVADLCDAIASALRGDPDTASLAASWQALTERADALSSEQRSLDREVRRARARLYVADGAWDRESAAFGRAVVDASGGKRESAQYKRFFANVTPSKAQTLGAAREIALGERWVEELGRAPSEPLAATFGPRLTSATSALREAVRERASSLERLAVHRTTVALFIDDVNRELDRTDGELLRTFPGDRGRAASYLAITRLDTAPRARARAGAESEDELPVSV